MSTTQGTSTSPRLIISGADAQTIDLIDVSADGVSAVFYGEAF